MESPVYVAARTAAHLHPTRLCLFEPHAPQQARLTMIANVVILHVLSEMHFPMHLALRQCMQLRLAAVGHRVAVPKMATCRNERTGKEGLLQLECSVTDIVEAEKRVAPTTNAIGQVPRRGQFYWASCVVHAYARCVSRYKVSANATNPDFDFASYVKENSPHYPI
jgi:hypothetical protein